MSKPERVQRRRTKGWRMPEGAVYVGRATKWGNPFRVEPTPWGSGWRVLDHRGQRWGDYPNRVDALHRAVDLFDLHIGPMGNYEYDRDKLAEMGRRLKGRDLVCWCPPELPCHADVLLRWANSAAVIA